MTSRQYAKVLKTLRLRFCISGKYLSHSAYLGQVIFDLPGSVFKGRSCQNYFCGMALSFLYPGDNRCHRTSCKRMRSNSPLMIGNPAVSPGPCHRTVEPRPAIAKDLAVGVFLFLFTARCSHSACVCVVLDVTYPAAFENVQRDIKIFLVELTSMLLAISFIEIFSNRRLFLPGRNPPQQSRERSRWSS